MLTTLTFDRPAKNAERSLILSDISPRRAAILMPSSEGLDVHELLKKGVFTKTTQQWWIERDETMLRALRLLRRDLGLDNVEIIHGELENFVPPEPVDFVNADMMGAFGPGLGCWFERIQPKLLNGATLIVTVTQFWRNQPFLEWFSKFMWDGEFGERVRAFSDALGIVEPQDVIPRVLLACALHNKHFDWCRNARYRDADFTKWTMATMRVDNLRPHENSPWIPFSELARAYYAQHIPSRHNTDTLRNRLLKRGLDYEETRTGVVLLNLDNQRVVATYDSVDILREIFS